MKHSLSRKLCVKGYYLLARMAVSTKPAGIPADMMNRRNIFIYFDYEREFSGHKTDITDENIRQVIQILEQAGIKSTWFTVGKIFEKYPDSVSCILSSGHEVASHTYGHIAPLWVSHRTLKRDFEKFREVSADHAEVSGFHAPNGKWTLRTGRLLEQYGFCYDMVKDKKNRGTADYYSPAFGEEKNLIRLYTRGDDWPLFRSGTDPESARDFFLSLVSEIKPGELGGIGFHPWVLFSDKNFLEGFISFISLLPLLNDVNINTAAGFALQIRNVQ